MPTRATEAPTLPGYALRYVLEVWEPGGTSPIHRAEQLQQADAGADFTFNLEKTGSYNILVWADFVSENPEKTEKSSPNTYEHYTDLYYQTDKGLKEVTIIQEAYLLNQESRDAFCAKLTIDKEEGALEKTIILKRPFGQLNIIEKEPQLLENVDSISCTYSVPDTYNVDTGKYGNTLLEITHTASSLPTSTSNCKANILYDYIFAPSGSNLLLGEMTLQFESSDSLYIFRDFIIPANNLPIVRNKRTNAYGNLLHQTVAPNEETTISITIESLWEDDNEHQLPASESGKLPNFNNQDNPFKNS